MEDRACSGSSAEEKLPDADARLLEQIRSGDAEAGQRFVREHYRAIYRYLLYLTRQPDWAEDLTQETFLLGWRRLETFRGRGTLRSWLLRIAHREFLHRLQRRQVEPGLEGIAEVAAPDATAWMQNVELREAVDRLPLEQREVVVLHDLEGYSSSEVASIVRAPASTVRRRLSQAREQLRQDLGEGDLLYLNELLAPMRQWHWLPLDQMHALEARLHLGGKASKEQAMERREFLRQEAQSPAGLAFTKMTLAQQQQFLANAISGRAAPLQSLDELAGSVLRVDYTQPGWFEWPAPEDWLRWRLTIEPGPTGRRELRAPIRERTREAAAAALRRLEPQVRAASGKTEVTPTRHYLAIVYIPGGTSTRRPLRVITSLEWTGVADF